jgi:replicative DNA helicase
MRAAEVEKVILGICLLEDEASQELAFSLLSPACFSLDSHQRIFRVVAAMFADRQPLNLLTLSQELDRNKELQAVGGSGYLADLTTGIPRHTSDESIRNYCERIKESWRCRELQSLGELLAAESTDGSESAEMVQTATVRLEQIVAESGDKDISASAGVLRTWEEFTRRRSLQRSPGIPYGIVELDRQTGGMMPGWQTAVGAMPGVGKTTMMGQAILETLRAGHGVDAFLYEPTEYEVHMRILSLITGIEYSLVTCPWKCPKAEADALWQATLWLGGQPLRIHDRAGMTLDEQLGKARLAIHRYDSRLICTDYIQRMKIRASERDEPMRLKVGRASSALADLVKGTKAHSLLLSQLGTGRKSGVNAVPSMFDFRESGQIEADAHTIILLHRPYDDARGSWGDEGCIFVPKHRFGIP